MSDRAQSDEVRLGVAGIVSGHPELPTWNPVNQTAADINVLWGQFIRFNPNDGAQRAYLPVARSGDAGRMVAFGNWSDSTTPYTIYAHPGDLIDGQPTATISIAWRKVICIVVGQGKLMACGDG